MELLMCYNVKYKQKTNKCSKKALTKTNSGFNIISVIKHKKNRAKLEMCGNTKLNGSKRINIEIGFAYQ